MSSQSRIQHIMASRVLILTVGELADALTYRLNNDLEVQPKDMSEQQCQEALSAIKQYMLETYGTVPRT